MILLYTTLILGIVAFIAKLFDASSLSDTSFSDIAFSALGMFVLLRMLGAGQDDHGPDPEDSP